LQLNQKKLLKKRVGSYRQRHSYDGTIINATALFIPFFQDSLVGTFIVIQFISVVPITLFIWAILLMLNIFRTKPLALLNFSTMYHNKLKRNDEEVFLFNYVLFLSNRLQQKEQY
jgi:hypothetical protein